MLFTHYTQVPTHSWPWKNFTPQELACRGTGELLINEHAINCLQALREALGIALTIHSAYRSPIHNARVGGAPLSQHKFARAFDIGTRNVSADTLMQAALAVGFTGIGVGAKTFLHVDTGPRRTWRYA